MNIYNSNDHIIPVLVDCDAGIDDAWSILMLLAEDKKCNIKVTGITCVHGNTTVYNSCINVLRTLHSVNRTDVPVYKGAHSPLIVFDNHSRQNAVGFFGADGFGDAVHEETPDDKLICEENGVVALNRIVNEHKGEITILCFGPLTNVALAIRTYPNFEDNVKEIIMMGGNYQAVGNTTNCAEFNFHADPEAANIVLGSAIKHKTLVPWEACCQCDFSLEWRDDVLGSCDNACIQLMNNIERPLRRKSSFVSWMPCDQVVAAVLIDPAVTTDSQHSHLTVELHGYHTRGQVVVSHKAKLTPNVKIVKKFNKDLLAALLLTIHEL